MNEQDTILIPVRAVYGFSDLPSDLAFEKGPHTSASIHTVMSVTAPSKSAISSLLNI